MKVKLKPGDNFKLRIEISTATPIEFEKEELQIYMYKSLKIFLKLHKEDTTNNSPKN